MAYPIVEAPYGFKPVRRVDGAPFNSAIRHYPIASGYATALGYGTLLKLEPGTVEAATFTTAGSPIGVFVGCEYTNPITKQRDFNHQWPAGTVADDAVAFVVDDPMALFQIAVVSGTTTMHGVPIAAIGQNAAIVVNSVNTATGNAREALNSGTLAATAALPLRIVDVVRETAYDSSGILYREVLVKLNTHAMNAALGAS